MRILLVGYKHPRFEAFTDYVERALKEMGHEVSFFDFRAYRLPGRLRERVPALESADRAWINRRLKSALAQMHPRLFLVLGGHTLEPGTIHAAKEGGATTALWTADYPLMIETYIALAPHYDHYFLSGTDVVAHHRSAGNDRGHFLPFACLPSLHKPVTLDPGEERLFRSEVAFAGTPYPERVALLAAIARLGVDLAIWGLGWDRLPAGHPLVRHVRGGPLRAPDYVKAVSGTKIAFNHMGYPMAPQMEELCNLRVFELLGCGACQLVDPKRDVLALFQPGREVVCFDGEEDLTKQVRHYLDHEDERKAIGARAREAALAGHTFEHRLKDLLSVCGLS